MTQNDKYGLYFCRQCVALYSCGSSTIMEDVHMEEKHPGYPGSWDHFEYEMRDFQERFWTAYEERRW